MIYSITQTLEQCKQHYCSPSKLSATWSTPKNIKKHCSSYTTTINPTFTLQINPLSRWGDLATSYPNGNHNNFKSINVFLIFYLVDFPNYILQLSKIIKQVNQALPYINGVNWSSLSTLDKSTLIWLLITNKSRLLNCME